MDATTGTQFGSIAARRVNTSLGARKEPVTYWITESGTQVRNPLRKRLLEIRLGLTGTVPGGLLFPISSIDDVPDRAYKMQDDFIFQLVAKSGRAGPLRLAGLGTPNVTQAP
jgi:hypothetical protein